MFRILQVTASYKPAFIYGGPTISVSRLCEALEKTANKVTVLTTTANGDMDFDIEEGDIKNIDGVNVVYFHRKTKDHSHWSPGLLKYLYKHIHQYDIVHIQAWWNLVSMGSAFVCKIKNKRIVLSPRGTLSSYTFGSKRNPFKRIFHITIGNWLLKNAYFLVSSEKEGEDIKSIIKNPYIKVIPNLIQLADWESPLIDNKISAELKLVFFSRIEKKKGLEFMLKALNKADFNFIFDIYGSGEVDYIAELKSVISPSIQCKINWKGSVFGDDKFRLLQAYDLMVLPSYDENFANVVIESLSVGTAVLITRKVGLSDYVEKQGLGWICEQSTDKIIAILKTINEDRKELIRISQVAPALIQTDFSEQNLIKQYITFYNSVLKSTS